MLEALLPAVDPLAVELLELLQAARAATRAAAVAALAILTRECLNIGLLLLYPWV
jgi:hypothetical protein